MLWLFFTFYVLVLSWTDSLNLSYTRGWKNIKTDLILHFVKIWNRYTFRYFVLIIFYISPLILLFICLKVFLFRGGTKELTKSTSFNFFHVHNLFFLKYGLISATKAISVSYHIKQNPTSSWGLVFGARVLSFFFLLNFKISDFFEIIEWNTIRKFHQICFAYTTNIIYFPTQTWSFKNFKTKECQNSIIKNYSDVVISSENMCKMYFIKNWKEK